MAELDQLLLHNLRGRQDMDTRRTRKNGWNEIITAYMGRLPANWPFLSMVTDPRLRTALVEKDARLINAKLRGRLVPREGGNVIKAKIQNALLDFQWDYVHEGGSMLEKVALASQYARLFGAAFLLSYWDVNRETNEVKVIDPRDIYFDGACTHIRNARWVQIIEYTTWDRLAARGFKVSKLRQMAQKEEIGPQWKSTRYESIVKANRGLFERTGEYDEKKNPVVEVCTEWTPTNMTIFLPRFAEILEDKPNPYKHGKIPVTMLRYHPLIDDIYGETDAEYCVPLQRAINATLCGFIDEMTIAMRPPLKISSRGVRIETIEYGPGAQWIMENPNLVQEMQFSPQTIANFNATYPALVAAFNTAMGDQSLGISNVKGSFTEKTATEVKALAGQQNSRDQSDQNYLAEFLEDLMMMWIANNKQYLFDDPKKHYLVLKVVGKDNVQAFQQVALDGKELRPQDAEEIRQTIDAAPEGVTDDMINKLVNDIAVPTHPVVLNPGEKEPSNLQVKPKLDVVSNDEANLYLTPADFEGEYEYIPDVESMAAGATQAQKDARQQAIGMILNPISIQLLAQEGQMPAIKELLVSTLEDTGMKDAESVFKPIPQQPQMGGVQNGGNFQSGQGAPGSSPIPGQPGQLGGLPGLSQAVPGQPGPAGIPGSQGL